MSIDKANQKGITMISLVVTIIVIIILATTSINVILNQQGILKTAQGIDEMQTNATTQEEESTNKMLEEHSNLMENPPVDPTANWDTRKVDKVLSEDNVFVPVPKGYVASTIDGEKSVANGFVIKEGTNGAATSGINEFVWVPVSDINDIYDAQNDAGQLWDFSGTTSTKITYPTTKNSGEREPDVVTNADEGTDSSSGIKYDAVSDNLQQAGLPDTATAQDFKVQLQQEFKGMIESVKIYGGFYIGRYETGDLSLSNGSKAVVQKYNTDIGSQTWYTQYKLNKTIAANSSVTTSMIWGCQWDATLRWMQTSSDEKVKNFATNSSAYGNYKDNTLTYKESASGDEKTTTEGTATKIPTGGSATTNINNIYDMAGNVWEWTMEAYSSYRRVLRGLAYNYDSTDYSAYKRKLDNSPTNVWANFGSRSTLYITP